MSIAARIIEAQKKQITSIEGQIEIERARLIGMRQMMVALEIEPPQPKKRERVLSKKWQSFFKFIEDKDGCSLDELVKFSSSIGINRHLLRVQMHYYLSKGHITKEESSGKFQINRK